jgi:hypothetical protein
MSSDTSLWQTSSMQYDLISHMRSVSLTSALRAPLRTAVGVLDLDHAAAATANATWWQPAAGLKFDYVLAGGFNPSTSLIPGVQVHRRSGKGHGRRYPELPLHALASCNLLASWPFQQCMQRLGDSLPPRCNCDSLLPRCTWWTGLRQQLRQ